MEIRKEFNRLVNLDIEEGIYNAVRWDGKRSRWIVKKVRIKRSTYLYEVLIKDFNNDNKSVRQSVSKLNIDHCRSCGSWVYSKDLTVNDIKNLIIDKKREQVREQYSKYESCSGDLEFMISSVQDS